MEDVIGMSTGKAAGRKTCFHKGSLNQMACTLPPPPQSSLKLTIRTLLNFIVLRMTCPL